MTNTHYNFFILFISYFIILIVPQICRWKMIFVGMQYYIILKRHTKLMNIINRSLTAFSPKLFPWLYFIWFWDCKTWMMNEHIEWKRWCWKDSFCHKSLLHEIKITFYLVRFCNEEPIPIYRNITQGWNFYILK